MDTEITPTVDDQGRGRYALLVDGLPAGEVDFRTRDGRRIFTHTGVRDEYEGQGLAGMLARRALDDARAEGIQVVAECPYMRSYIQKHPHYQDLLLPG